MKVNFEITNSADLSIDILKRKTFSSSNVKNNVKKETKIVLKLKKFVV